MNTTLIELQDGVYIEAIVRRSDLQPVSGGLPDRVQTSLEALKPIILRVCGPIKALWPELNQDIKVEKLEIEFGLSFEAEGNIFVTRAKTEANITVTVSFATLLPKPALQ
jgi:NTP-dependent ternary system trypsin peptidase co-occuring protein